MKTQTQNLDSAEKVLAFAFPKLAPANVVPMLSPEEDERICREEQGAKINQLRHLQMTGLPDTARMTTASLTTEKPTANSTAQLLKMRETRQPAPVLKPGTIYSADNGQLICLHCAGMAAKFTGRDRSGMKVASMTQEDAAEWEAMLNKPMACERGCTTYGSANEIKVLELA